MNEQPGKVRRARTRDVEALMTIDHRAAKRDVERVSAIHEHVSDGVCWINSDQSDFNAYAVLLPRHFFGRDFLELLMVAPSVRRSGVATTFLSALLDLEGTSQVFTSTNRSNAPMIGLLRKEQWQLSGELDGLDADDPELVFFTWRP